MSKEVGRESNPAEWLANPIENVTSTQFQEERHERNPSRWWNNAKGRVDPHGFMVSYAISNLGWPTILPTQAALSALIHEASKENRPDQLAVKLGVVAVTGAIAAKSVSLEAQAFREKKYSISPPGTIFNAAIGKPLVAATVEHTADHVQFALVNPYFLAGLVHNDPELMVDSFIATSLTLSAWNIFWNRLIVNGKIDPVANKLKPITDKFMQARDFLVNKAKNFGAAKSESNPNVVIAPSGNLSAGVFIEIPSNRTEDSLETKL